MEPITLTELILPIAIASVACFIASFLLWAVLPLHNAEIKELPDQAAFDQAVGSLALPPGFYMAPCTHDPKVMKSDAFKQRYDAGPWMTVNVMPAKPSMGRNMALTFAMFAVVSFFVAYLASATTLGRGAEYLSVFRIVGTAAFMAYAFGGLGHAIWFGKPARAFATEFVDTLVYTGITAGIFAAMWPGAPTTPAG